jgi:hypothetical protein
MTPLFDFDSVVDVLGGPTAVARLTYHRASQSVCNWRNKRGRLFPAKHYFVIKCALAEKGFLVPISLFDFTEPAKLRKSAA